MSRAEVKKREREFNQVGRRLSWVRSRLVLTITAVSEGSGIPKASYFDREASFRTSHYEEFVHLADFFNNLWQKKFKSSYPDYMNFQVVEITPAWLVFGHDRSAVFYKKMISEMWTDFRRQEFEYIERINDLEKRIKDA